MRILFYINSLATGGAERTVTKLANTLADATFAETGAAQHQVTIVTQQPSSTDKFALSSRIQRRSTESGQTSASIVQALGNNLRRISRLRTILKQEQPQVIVAFMATANTVATFAALGLKIPVIVSERNYPPALELSTMHRVAQRVANKCADHMVVLTQQTLDWYRDARGLQALSVIPNGVTYPILTAPGITPVEPQSIVPEHAKVILCVGRISDQKQPQLALQAFAALGAKAHNWHLVWLGRGDTDALNAAAKTLGIQDRFHAPGAVGNVQDWYERAQIYLMTSAHEGFPNSLIEAMACGCASIALDCPTGPRDIIRNGRNGILLPFSQPYIAQAQIGQEEIDQEESNRESISAVTDALASLMADAELRQMLGDEARNVREVFSDKAAHELWTALLDRVASS